jgi:PAS domain S-box-containing protein
MPIRLARIAAALLLAALPLAAQQRALKIYTSADGLGHNRVYRIVSDTKGFLWFCTFDGLTRFDGQHFVNFSSSNGAPFATAMDLLELPGGDYWIASRGQGLIRFSAGVSRFKPYRVGNDAASNNVNVLHRDRSGVVWLGTDGGIYAVHEQKGSVEIHPVRVSPPGHSERDLQVWGLTEDPEGSVYAGTRFGVARFLPDGRRVFYRYLPDYRADELGSVVFHEGVLWLGQPGGLFLLRPSPPGGSEFQVDDALVRAAELNYPSRFALPDRPGQAVLVRLDRDPPRNYVFAIHKLTADRIWIASQGAMFEHSRGALRPILRDIPFNFALEIGQDAAGNAWLSTDGLGVAKVESTGSASFSQADGLGPIPVGTYVDNTGDVVVPSWPRQLAIFNGERFKRIELKLAPKADFTGMRSVLQDHASEWWVATSAGLYRFPKVLRPEDLANVPPKAVYTHRDGLGDDEVWYPFEDAAGDIWMAGSRSPQPTISRWQRGAGRFTFFSVSDGLPSGGDRLIGIVQDADKGVWFAYSEGGLVRYRDGRFQAYGQAQGLPSAKIAGIASDPRGRIWCSIVGHGLVRIDAASGDRIALQQYSGAGQTNDMIGGPVFADPQGRIYWGLMHGVDRLDPATGVVTHYGPADGVPDGPIYSISADTKGGIWISARKNIVRILPDAARDTAPAPVLISAIRISGVDYQVPVTGSRTVDLRKLSYQKNSIEVEFLSLSSAPGQSPLFQYKLDGAESDWSAPTPFSRVNYANLSPGEYRFQARLAPRGDGAGEVPAQITFRILQPFWYQRWFIGSILLLVAGSLGGFERYRAAKVRQLRASEESFRTLAETASDAIITIDEHSIIHFCNSSAADIFGYPTAQMIGRELTMLMPPHLREAHRSGFGNFLKNGVRRMSWKAAELPGLHADGREISLELSFGEFKRGEARFFTAVVRDVTERKRTEEALRRSREERIAEIERVRRRIAVDLHDDIGSSLTQISVLSEVARREVAGSSSLERPLELIAGSARELIDSMSDIVWAINPQRDHLADLVHRMRRFAADTLTARNIEFSMELPGPGDDIKLEGNLRREVFLIFKEALNNAVRHSGCTRAAIELRLENHRLRLHLRDNGRGFDAAQAADGHGLMSMSGRAAGIGARFEISSQPGGGCAITLELPLDAASALSASA